MRISQVCPLALLCTAPWTFASPKTSKRNPDAPRCVTAQTASHQCLLDAIVAGGDGLALQVWENGKALKCRTKDHLWASQKSVWHFTCDGGAKAEVSNNGGHLVFTSGNGWSADLPRTNGGAGRSGRQEYGVTARHPYYGYDFEHIFATDALSNPRTSLVEGASLS
jgi:hypothetical protein